MLTVDFARLDVGPRTRVLDIGCGNGRHALEALRRGADVTATDIDEAALHEVERRAAQMRDTGDAGATGRLRTVCADVLHLPFGDGAFDVVIAAEVLEHIDQDSAAIAELRRVLRSGGVIAVTVPRWWPERVCWALSEQYHTVPGGHVRIYRRTDLERNLRASGLEIAAPHHYAHALHTPYWWLRCIVGITRERALPARLYHRFLVYDLMRRPAWTQQLERVLNPLLGKSVVIYARRAAGAALARSA